MALYIRDEAVDDLAKKVMLATSAKTKTDAVRKALLFHLEAVTQEKPLLDRLRDIQNQADTIGPVDPTFDMKGFSDELHEA